MCLIGDVCLGCGDCFISPVREKFGNLDDTYKKWLNGTRVVLILMIVLSIMMMVWASLGLSKGMAAFVVTTFIFSMLWSLYVFCRLTGNWIRGDTTTIPFWILFHALAVGSLVHVYVQSKDSSNSILGLVGAIVWGVLSVGGMALVAWMQLLGTQKAKEIFEKTGLIPPIPNLPFAKHATKRHAKVFGMEGDVGDAVGKVAQTAGALDAIKSGNVDRDAVMKAMESALAGGGDGGSKTNHHDHHDGEGEHHHHHHHHHHDDPEAGHDEHYDQHHHDHYYHEDHDYHYDGGDHHHHHHDDEDHHYSQDHHHDHHHGDSHDPSHPDHHEDSHYTPENHHHLHQDDNHH